MHRRPLLPSAALAIAASLATTGCLPADTDRGADLGASTTSEQGTAGGHVVERVVDGDTLTLTDGTRIRLLGIDTPELAREGREADCGAEDAASHLASLAGPGTTVRVELDVETTDRYGRTLAWLWTGDTLVNEQITRAGWARMLIIAPNGRHGERIRDAAASAQNARVGIWGLCPAG